MPATAPILIRDLLCWLVQELIEAEAAAAIGADRYERSGERLTHRNGHRPTVWSTIAGDLELGIPKFRKGSFFPEILEPRRRIDQALYAVVMEPTSTACRPEPSMTWWWHSGSTPASPNPKYRESAPVWLSGSKRSETGHVSRAIVIATGITADGHREVLGVDIGDPEEETFWTRFLRSVKKRGLSGVRLVISDAHEGLKAAIRRCLQGSWWQRCRVHYIRNLLAVIPNAHTEMVAAVFRSIFTQATAEEVHARWERSHRH